jgi:hypothetical protein
MQPIEFAGQNVVLGKGQPQYQPLPAHRSRNDGAGTVTTCWQLTPDEIIAVINTGRVWIQQLTFGNGFQPQLPLVGVPPALEP